MLTGYITLPWWGYVLVTLGMTHITIASVTIFLHRHQTHRALELHPAAAHFFRFWLFLTTGIVTKAWVAVHRKHHALVETPDDPHSPHNVGIRTLLSSGAEVYAEAYRQHPEVLATYGHGTPNDWLERYLYGRSHGTWLGVALLDIVYVLAFGPIGLTMWAIQMMWIPFFAAGVINGMGHWWGYRNHACPDASTNLIPWGILIGGEELHNNHHAFASSARFSSQAWEFDIGWWYIRALRALGLARVKKIAPRLYRNPRKSLIDEDTVRAVASCRLQVLSDYTKHAVQRIYREQCEPEDPTNRPRRYLTRSQSPMDTAAEQRRAQGLRDSAILAKVHHFQTRLQTIAQETPFSLEQQRQLQEWCQQARTSGIAALEQFSEILRSYSLQPGTAQVARRPLTS